jgi:hypothetical protein
VDKSLGLISNQTIILTGAIFSQGYPEKMRRVKHSDADTNKTFVFLTNSFSLPVATIAELYRYRWQVGLFFKWIKQHPKIKAFFGHSENAIKSQIWIPVSVYVFVAIIRKRLKL